MLENIRAICESEMVLKKAEQAIAAQLAREGRPDEAGYVIYRTQLEDVLVRQQRLLDQSLGGHLGEEQFRRMNQALLDEEARLRATVERLEREAMEKEFQEQNLGAVMAILRNFERFFHALTSMKQKLVVRVILRELPVRGRHIDWQPSSYHEPFASLLHPAQQPVSTI